VHEKLLASFFASHISSEEIDCSFVAAVQRACITVIRRVSMQRFLVLVYFLVLV
jgi:hypothetical protein